MKWIPRGKIFDAELQTAVESALPLARIEETPRAAALLFALGAQFRLITPSEDSGRAWYQFEHTPAVADALRQLVDFCGDMIYSAPSFTQLVLFDEEIQNG